MRYTRSDTAGVTLVEVVIGVSIVGFVLVSIAFALSSYVQSASITKEKTKALFLAEEGVEALHQLRNDSWTDISSLALDTTHYLEVSTSTIAATTTAEVIDGEYYRSFVLTSVYRDNQGDIVASTTAGAMVDADAREVRVTVAGPHATASLSSLVPNIHEI